jgi:hypothetical protein
MGRFHEEVTAVLAAVAIAVPARGAAQSGAASGAFVVTLGTDTVAVERYARTATTLTGDMIVRNNAPVVWRHYNANLAADGRVTRYEFTNTRLFPGGVTQPALHLVGTFRADSTVVAGTFLDSAVSLSAATPGGAMPFVNYSYALYELYFARARATAGNAQTTLTLISPGDAQLTARVVRVVRPDSASVGFTDEVTAMAFRLDGAGRILAVDGRATSEKFTAIRVASIDLEALKTAFAGRPLGRLSPPDSVRAAIGGASIAIDYSRPSMRGRKIFGDAVVPWNQVWRAGANAATRFTTSADLMIGGATVPAGTYTLFTLPSPSGWKLIFSKQTKAPCKTAAECADPRRAPLWGTDYSADSDLVRVDMQVASLPQPVEQFRIAVEPQGAGGVLKLDWETTRAWVAFAKKEARSP